MPRTIDIHGYSNNGGKGARPRQPLVHMLASRYGELQSMTFHPDDAPAIAKAILAAAQSALRFRNRSITVKIKSED